MPYVDFGPLIHELMVRDLSIAAFMNELLVAHENAHPQYDWSPLKALGFDESESLLQRWLVPTFKREPPRAKRVTAIWCGLFQPIRDEETVADMYIAGTRDFELDQVPRKWNVHPEYWPLLRYAHSRVLANLYRCAYGESGPGNDAENYLCLGYAAKTISTLLGRVDAEPILGSRKEVQVAVGWDSGEPLYIGHLGRAGFVPRPVAEAKARLHLQSTRTEEYGRQQEQERKERTRHFRHPDGRVWSISVTNGSIELRFTDTDGEDHHRTRFRKWVVEDMAAIATSGVRLSRGVSSVSGYRHSIRRTQQVGRRPPIPVTRAPIRAARRGTSDEGGHQRATSVEGVRWLREAHGAGDATLAPWCSRSPPATSSTPRPLARPHASSGVS